MRPILWIDDELDLDNALILLLAFEGFRIELARTGVEGLAKACSGSYDGIVLDLRLPDMFGLSVLKRLVAQHAPAILVVTGYYHEPEMADEVIRAGAAAFRHKPLIDIDDLSTVLRSLPDLPYGFCETTQDSALNATAALPPEAQRPFDTNRTSGSVVAVITDLSIRLADRQLTSLAFIEMARLIRKTISSSLGSSIRLSLPVVHGIDALPQNVREIIRELESEANARHTPLEADVETRLGMARGAPGRLLTRYTGAGYREWSRALRLRPAVHLLASSDEHIRQIAFRIGYEHASQFDRDFRRTFGLAPTEYRRFSSMAAEQRNC